MPKALTPVDVTEASCQQAGRSAFRLQGFSSVLAEERRPGEAHRHSDPDKFDVVVNGQNFVADLRADEVQLPGGSLTDSEVHRQTLSESQAMESVLHVAGAQGH